MSEAAVKTGSLWPTGLVRRAALSNAASLLLLGALFWIVAAASFSGFAGKWSLRDGARRYGIEAMLDGTAHKPFVYRQLAPMVSGLASRVTPDRVKNYLVEKLQLSDTFARATAPASSDRQFRHLVIYYACFASLFLCLFVLRRIVLDAGGDDTAAIIAPTSFILAFPYLQTIGGYFYDSIELLFLSLAFLMATRGKGLLLMALVAPATLNKETFFFFLPALYPLLRRSYSAKASAALVATGLIVAGSVNVLLKLAYADAPGGAAEFHFLDNLDYYRMFWVYHLWEVTYGVVGPQGLSVLTLAVALIVAMRGWPAAPPAIRQHLAIAAAINLPLFLVFCGAGELRNLSFLFVGFVVLLAACVAPTRRASA